MSDDVGFAVPFTKAREKVSVRGSGVQQSKHNVIICRAVGRSENCLRGQSREMHLLFTHSFKYYSGPKNFICEAKRKQNNEELSNSPVKTSSFHCME